MTLAPLVIRRLGEAILLMLLVSMVAFTLAAWTPGEFTDDIQINPHISVETIQALRTRYALDKPLPVRYGAWLRATVSGDFGFSFTYGLPVATLFWPRARNTLLLSGLATLAAWLCAVPLGVFGAMRKGRAADRATMALTSVPLASSDLLIALTALWLGAHSRLFPIGGMTSVAFDTMTAAEQWRDLRWHLALPLVALTVVLLPPIYRQVRAAVIEAAQSPHVDAARAHGLSSRQIVRGYVLPLAANSQISLLGLSVAGLLGTSLVIEIVMGWPGLGPLLLEATFARDHDVVVGVVVASALLVWLANSVADVLLYMVDPRVRMAADR